MLLVAGSLANAIQAGSWTGAYCTQHKGANSRPVRAPEGAAEGGLGVLSMICNGLLQMSSSQLAEMVQEKFKAC